MRCCLLDHMIGPLECMMRYPEIERVVNSGYLGGVDDGGSLDWSCGPQLASVRAVGVEVGRVKLMKLEISDDGLC